MKFCGDPIKTEAIKKKVHWVCESIYSKNQSKISSSLLLSLNVFCMFIKTSRNTKEGIVAKVLKIERLRFRQQRFHLTKECDTSCQIAITKRG